MIRLICQFDMIRLQRINVCNYCKRIMDPFSVNHSLIFIFLLPGSSVEHVNIPPAVIIIATEQRCSIFKMLIQEDQRIRSNAPGKTSPLAGARSGSSSGGSCSGDKIEIVLSCSQGLFSVTKNTRNPLPP